MKTFLFFLITKIFSQITYQTQVNLLKLSKHWEGEGVSFLYPNKLKILSSKLNSQSGIMKTSGKLLGGSNWKLDISLNFDCKDRFIEENCGIAIWISKQKKKSVNKYNFENNFKNYGANKNIDGFMILISGRSLYMNIFKTQKLNRKMILGSPICKIYPDSEKNYFLRVKYTGKDILGIYILDKKNGNEQICYQFVSKYDFDEFFLSVSGSDWHGQCSGEVNQLTFFSSFKLNFVQLNEKMRGDSNLCLFDEKELKNSVFLDNWKKTFDYEKSVNENAKILSNKIIEFADKDPKEFLRDIKNKMSKNANTLDDALEVIKTEAYILQNLGDFLVSKKNSQKSDLEEVFSQIFDWTDQLEESFERVDVETNKIFKNINKINLDLNIKKIFNKSDDLISQMDSVLKKIEKMKEGKKINFPDKRDFRKIDKRLKNLKKDEIDDLNGNLNKMKIFGMFVISFIGIFIIFLFLSVFYKIRKVNRNKRFL